MKIVLGLHGLSNETYPFLKSYPGALEELTELALAWMDPMAMHHRAITREILSKILFGSYLSVLRNPSASLLSSSRTSTSRKEGPGEDVMRDDVEHMQVDTMSTSIRNDSNSSSSSAAAAATIPDVIAETQEFDMELLLTESQSMKRNNSLKLSTMETGERRTKKRS